MAERSSARLEGLRVAVVLKWAGLGGAERQALLLARHLRDAEGADVFVHALSDADGRAATLFQEAGIPWRARRGRWRGSRPRTVGRLFRAAAALRREHADVLLPYCDVPNVVCGLIWRHSGARTCVWNQRDTLPFTLDDTFVRRALRATPVLVSNSEHGADLLAERGAARERIRVIANGVGLLPPQFDRREWRRRLGIADDAVAVTSVAHFYVRKEHETLLQGWRGMLERTDGGLGGSVLVLAGRSEGRREVLEQLVDEHGMADSVRFAGDVEDVAGLLGASDVGILSSPTEGLPNAVLEYMAAGLPVVGSDIPGIRDALGDAGEPLLVPPANAQALASALAAVCADSGLRERLGAENRARQRRLFGAERMLDESVGAILDGLELARLRRA